MTAITRRWLYGALAALISGAAGGIITGLAAIGVDPEHFNLTVGFMNTMKIGGASLLMHAIIGVAMYFQKAPLPPGAADATPNP